MTADSRSGLFRKPQDKADLLHPRRFGRHEFHGIPFELVDPSRTAEGRNVIALRGGFENAKVAYPQRVEIPLSGVALQKLHILHAGAGWGWPWANSAYPKTGGEIALKITITREDGTLQSQDIINGKGISDHNYKAPLPEAKSTGGFLEKDRLLRTVSLSFPSKSAARSITLETLNNQIVPIILGLTAEVSP